MSAPRKYISEFVGLDLLRFILAVVVVVVHYYHFYGPFPNGPFKDNLSIIPEQPLYFMLWPLYDYGRNAVQVFWLISGLIFYSVYYQEIANRKVSFEKFSFLRFTRLYPLHFLTIISALVLQMVFYSYHHKYFVYQTNDLSAFIAQIFFIGAWTPGKEFSFNAPMWSVSIEIFVYVVFYMLAVISFLNGKKLFLLIGVSLVFVQYGILRPFEGCLLYFLSGCLLARMFEEGASLRSLLIRYVVLGVVFGVFVKLMRLSFSESQLEPFANLIREFKNVPFASALVVFFILAFKNISSPKLVSVFKQLGNMTYSVYAVHFSIQVAMFLIISPSTYKTFDNPIYLFVFLALSIVGGYVAFEYFERPVQKYLRMLYQRRAPQYSVLSMDRGRDSKEEAAATGYKANSPAA